MSRAIAIPVVIVGGGHNGLAMSKRLSDRSVEHVVLERDDVASSWRTQRWDSFTLLTPNWQTQLPGLVYEGDDPDGFMTGEQIADFVESYAGLIDAPVHMGATVTSVRPADGWYDVATTDGMWRARSVVLACGPSSRAAVPEFAAAVPPGIKQVDPLRYRRPSELPDGGMLVVGAAATGVQLAEEIHASGRPVTLSVGEHVRMPRTYRARDIQYWMEAIGRLEERYDAVDDIRKARATASPQLVGTVDRRTLDLNRLSDAGVALRGRLGGIRDGVAMFSGGLRNHCALADQKLRRLLDEIDVFIDEHDMSHVGAVERYEPTRVDRGVPLTLDLTSGQVATIVWATGFTPDLSWLEVRAFDATGRLRHDGGIVNAPGLYLIGTTFLRRRKSSFIHGAGDDTEDLADHLVRYLARHGSVDG